MHKNNSHNGFINENKTRLHCIINMPKTLTNQYFISFTIQHFIPSTFKSLHHQHPQNNQQHPQNNQQHPQNKH